MAESVIANPDEADEMFSAAKAREAEKVEELTEAEKKKQKVLDSIREKTITVHIDGDWRARFTRIMDEDREWFREVNRKAEAGELTGKEDEEADERVLDILEDHSQTEWVDREFLAALPGDAQFNLMRDLMSGGDEADEAADFRDQR